jgi:uncharacterized protein (DUF58 family)
MTTARPSGTPAQANPSGLLAQLRAGLAPRPNDRVYIIPSRIGIWFVFLTQVTLAGCINYQLTLGYGLAFLLLAIWVMCAISASLSLKHVTVSLRPAGRSFCGEALALQVAFRTPGRSAPPSVSLGRLQLWLTEEDEGTWRGAFHLLGLPRGPVRLPRLWTECQDPVGLWQARRHPDLDSPTTELLIYPASEQNGPPLPLTRPGSAQSGRTAGQEETAGLRPYRPGDALKTIAWKQSARQDTLLSREYDAPGASSANLDWAETSGDTEARLSRLTAWVLTAERQGLTFSLSIPGTHLPPASGEAQVQRALDALARYPA